MAERNKLTWKKGRGIYKITSGWSTWRWLSGVSSKEKHWFIRTVMGRGGYESWMAHLTKGLQDPNFLLKFEGTTDPWERSKLVGQKISELRKSYMALTDEQRDELARQAEVELRTGLEMMGRDKKTIQELIALVDPTKEKAGNPTSNLIPLFLLKRCGSFAKDQKN